MTAKHLTTRTYVIVWIVLMALTLISYLVSLAHLGGLDVVVALVIATVKTVLVLLFFMHLIEQRFVNAFAIMVSASFLLLLVSLMVSDVETRRTFPRAPVPVMPPM